MKGSIDSPKLIWLGILLFLAIGIVASLPEPVQRLATVISDRPWLNLAVSMIFAWTGLFIAIRKLCCFGIGSRIALIAYFWAAVGMAGVYSLLYEFHDGCIRIENTELPITVLDFVYFSFVSVTTLGYGDMVPDHSLIRVLVVGQILFAGYLLYQISTGNNDSRNTTMEE